MDEVDDLRKELASLKNCVISLPGNITINPGEGGFAMVSQHGIAVFSGKALEDTVNVLTCYLNGRPQDIIQ